MIPLYDDVPARKFPVVTVTLIVINVIIFLFELAIQAAFGDDALNRLFYEAGVVPAFFSGSARPEAFVLPDGAAVPPFTPLSPVITPLTSMFLHGGVAHVMGNMLFLWIFGDNVEDRIGRFRFLLFYLLAGYIAALVHVLSRTDSLLPTVGASGAIAGVMGAYLVGFPKAKLAVIIPPFFFLRLWVPAFAFLILWFVLQFIGGWFDWASIGDTGGIAFGAHVGGFVVGLLAGWLVRSRPGWTLPNYTKDQRRAVRGSEYER